MLKLHVIAADNNNLHGTVPSSWAGMEQLTKLDLDFNCRLCGSLPTFPLQVHTWHAIIVSCTLYGKCPGNQVRTNEPSFDHAKSS